MFDGFFKFSFTSLSRMLPNANPGRYFSQYNLIVTDVSYQWKRESTWYRTANEIHTTACVPDQIALDHLLIRLFIYKWIFSSIIEYNAAASYNWIKWVSHEIFTLGRYLFHFLVSNHSFWNISLQFSFILELQLLQIPLQCRLINSNSPTFRKSWTFINSKSLTFRKSWTFINSNSPTFRKSRTFINNNSLTFRKSWTFINTVKNK